MDPWDSNPQPAVMWWKVSANREKSCHFSPREGANHVLAALIHLLKEVDQLLVVQHHYEHRVLVRLKGVVRDVRIFFDHPESAPPAKPSASAPFPLLGGPPSAHRADSHPDSHCRPRRVAPSRASVCSRGRPPAPVSRARRKRRELICLHLVAGRCRPPRAHPATVRLPSVASIMSRLMSPEGQERYAYIDVCSSATLRQYQTSIISAPSGAARPT